MSALSFAKQTIFHNRSRACLWRHPVEATRLICGAAANWLLPLGERLVRQRGQECVVCGWRGLRFRSYLAPGNVQHATICPECGAFDRHRHLVHGFREELTARGDVPRTILGCSLAAATRYVLEHEGLGRCFRMDYDHVDPRYAPDVIADLRRAGFRTGSVDWIICSHVLEHVAELAPAVDELLRILKPGGVAWLQVPIHDDLARSEPIPVDPADFDAHTWRFGRDVTTLLERPGWDVACHRAAEELDEATRHRYGIHPVESFWLARKLG